MGGPDGGPDQLRRDRATTLPVVEMAHSATERSLAGDLDTESALPGHFLYPSAAGGSAAELYDAVGGGVVRGG